jgi:hypothetical protein
VEGIRTDDSVPIQASPPVAGGASPRVAGMLAYGRNLREIKRIDVFVHNNNQLAIT